MVMAADYRIVTANAAYRRHYGGDVPVVGRFCYEVSHAYQRPCDENGESCPLAASRASGQQARALHLHHIPRGEEPVDVAATPMHDAAGRIAYFVERMQVVREAPAAKGLVGRPPAFNRMLEGVHRVAPSNSTALSLGEPGTVKDMVAQAIHEQNRRTQGPFVVVECSCLTETLFESELFGYEKGEFTGATRPKPGLLEAAAGGTQFLDEVGDIPLPSELGIEQPPAGIVNEIVPLATAELRHLQWALAHHQGDRKSLAALLGISERTLYRKLAG